MARYRDDYDYEDYYRAPRYTRASNAPAWTMAMIMLIGVVAFLVWLAPDLTLPSLPQSAPAATSGAIGNQAPPAAVRRAPAPASAPQAQPQAEAAPNAQQSIDQYNATAQAQYDQAVQQQAAPAAAATPVPLPLNSAGEPVIDQAQYQQQQQALTLAEQEGAAAVDQQLADGRATADAEALSRPPDVSKEDAEQMMHRDLCSVPRANPATCGQGLYKPTPVN